ncbi:hypothetical protein SGLAM104S_09015 [Streptomyces glaucescens]
MISTTARARLWTTGSAVSGDLAAWLCDSSNAPPSHPAGPDSADAVLEGLDPEQREVATALHGPGVRLAAAWHGQDPGHHPPHRLRGAGRNPPALQRARRHLHQPRRRRDARPAYRQLGATGVQARTFHSAALRQLQYFWPKAIGEPARLVDRKIQLVADAAAACRVRLDRGELRDVTAEIEWSKVTQTVPADYALAAAKAGPTPLATPPRSPSSYLAYEDLKRDRTVIDFEDVLLLTVARRCHARPHPSVRLLVARPLTRWPPQPSSQPVPRRSAPRLGKRGRPWRDGRRSRRRRARPGEEQVAPGAPSAPRPAAGCAGAPWPTPAS